MPAFITDLISQIVAVLTATFVSLTGVSVQTSPSTATISAIVDAPTQVVNTVSEAPIAKTEGTIKPSPTPTGQAINITITFPTATPTSTPTPIPTPKPTYACEDESRSSIRYSTEPCPQINRVEKSGWSGSCNSTKYQSLSPNSKFTYNLSRTTLNETLVGKAYIEIKKSDGTVVFPKQTIEGSGELPVKDFIKEADQYFISLESAGIEDGYSLCSIHTITILDEKRY